MRYVREDVDMLRKLMFIYYYWIVFNIYLELFSNNVIKKFCKIIVRSSLLTVIHLKHTNIHKVKRKTKHKINLCVTPAWSYIINAHKMRNIMYILYSQNRENNIINKRF